MKKFNPWKPALECVFILMLVVASFSLTESDSVGSFVRMFWIVCLPFVLPFVYNVSVVLSETVRLYQTEPKTIQTHQMATDQAVRFVKHNVMGKEREPILLTRD